MKPCPLAFLLLLLAAACSGGCQARELLQASDSIAMKVGVWKSSPFPLIYEEGGESKGYEVAIRKRIDELTGMTSEVVLLDSLDDRLTSLQDGRVDLILSSFSVTPERAQLVDFVLPYYFSAGATLFTPGGKSDGLTSWEDVRGKKLAVYEGYYANDELANKYGAELVIAKDAADGAAKVAAGEAVALVDDSAALKPAGDLQLIASIPPLLPTPFGIAVKKGNTDLASKISDALYQMATGGASSDLGMYEKEYYIDNGAAPNPDLTALLADPTGSSTLTTPIS